MTEEQHKNMESKIDRIEKKVNRIFTILDGNGKTGLCAKVNIMWGGFALLAITVSGLLIKTILKTFVG